MTERTGGEHVARERLRRRLIWGVVFSAVGFAVTVAQIGKNWNGYHTFGLVFGIVMLIGVSLYASSLKPDSTPKA